jgi:hypothetical protein
MRLSCPAPHRSSRYGWRIWCRRPAGSRPAGRLSAGGDRTALVVAGTPGIRTGDQLVFVKVVAVATAVVHRDGQARAGGHPAGHARLGAAGQQLDDLAGPGVTDEIAAQATLTGKVKGKVRRAMTAAFTIRATVLMALMPDAGYADVMAALLGDLVLVPRQRPYEIPTARVLPAWRTAPGPAPLTGKVKGKVRRAMTAAFTIRATVLMALMPDAGYADVMAALLGDLVLVPWQRPYEIPTARVLPAWRTAPGPAPLTGLQARLLAAVDAGHRDHDYRAVDVGESGHELRLGSIDGSVTRVPDTCANRAAFGSTGTADDSAPYPQVRDLLATDASTRAVLAVVSGPSGGAKAEGEQALPGTMLTTCRQIFSPDRLWVMDRNADVGITVLGGLHLTGVVQVGTPGPPRALRWRALQARWMSAGRWRDLPWPLTGHDVVVAHWVVAGRELEHSVEDEPAASRAAAVEAEHELVQVALQMRLVDRALMGAQKPPLGQRRDAVNTGKELPGILPAGSSGPLAARFVCVAEHVDAAVALPAVGDDPRTRLDLPGDERVQRGGGAIAQGRHPGPAVSSRFLDLHSDASQGLLALGPPPRNLGSSPPM